jgi:hypothetical protein
MLRVSVVVYFMKKIFFLVLVFLLTACGAAPAAQPSIPGLVTITPELPPFVAPLDSALPSLPPSTPTALRVQATATRPPETTAVPRNTATLPGPTPTETLLPPLELPTARAFAPSRMAWTGQPTYPADSQPGLLFRVDYASDTWALTEDNFGATVLAHRQIPYCILLPWSGRGLPGGLRVEYEFRVIGGANFDVHTITRDGNLEFVAYVGGDRKIVTGFQVAFEEQKEQCIEDAEAVLATLRSTPSP